MKFEKSKYFNTLKNFKLEKPFGNFYLCENFFIAELNEGVHFDWGMIKNTMKDILNHYVYDKKLGYISNIVNSYSMDPHHWNKVYKPYDTFKVGAIVYYNEMVYMNAALEKQMSDKSIKSFKSLKKAIDWMTSLKDLK